MSNSLTYLGTTYTDANIISGSFSKSESLNMAELPVDTVELTIRPLYHYGFLTSENYPFVTADGYTFQTTEANPLSASFQQNTPLVQYKDGSQTAIWYLQSIDRIGADIYKLNGISSLGRLTQRTHYGGIYNGTTASTILAEIMGGIPYYVDNVFKDVAVYGWLPIATARDNLQQLLFALNANLRTAADGMLRIENLSTAASATVVESDIFSSGANVKYNTPVTKVVVLEHQYSVGSETKQLFSGTTSGNQTVTFDEPISGLSASTGLAIVSSGANYAIINGTGTLTGTPYIHMTREISKDVTSANVENVVRVENATLVGLTASTDVANRLAAYYACRNVINVAVAASFLNVGDVANVYDPFDAVMRSTVIEKCQVGLSNTPKSTISALVGFTPWQQQAFVDVRVVVTSGNSYTFPADIENGTTVTAVLIAAGDGGVNGGDGGNGGGYEFHGTVPASTTKDLYYDAGIGGVGGVGGTKGKGGKILRTSIVVDASQTVALSVGQGGAANGGIGGETTLLTFTTANGGNDGTGYTDPITHDVFAVDGIDGQNGANGGNGGSLSGSDGESGGNAGTNNGGVGGTGYANPTESDSVYVGGGAGGGAAFNENGDNGVNGTFQAASWNHGVFNSAGGNGADGDNASAPVSYGCGGNGGNGAGGGGGAGASRYYNGGYYIPHYYQFDMVGTGGTGGTGGLGSAGVQGCIIFYFRKPIS